MKATTIANFIFWLGIASIFFAIYQAAILPSLRLTLRYRVFALRDRLRTLVINGTVKETDPAFNLLHGQLNFVSCNLFRYDLLRVAQSVHKITDEQKAYVESRVKIMEEGHEEIQKIYHESLDAVTKAVILNSLFLFLFLSLCLGLGLLSRVGILRLKEAFKRKVDEETRTVFVLPEFAAVAV
jgi:hypothetical protein